MHPVGGNVLCYAELARAMGKEQPFYGLQSRGLDPHQEPDTHIEAMAAHYIQALRPINTRGGYILGGWSMGGLVALEMAHQLQQQGASVAHLVLIDTWIPSPDILPADNEASLLAAFFADLRGTQKRDTRAEAVTVTALQALAPDKRLDYALAQARALDLVPPDAGATQFHRLLHVYRANIEAMRHYTPPTYGGDVTLFQAAEIAETAPTPSEWPSVFTGKFDMQTVPGNHYTLLTQPHVLTLARKLKQAFFSAKNS